MEGVKIIEATPLSVPEKLFGKYYWYEDFEALSEKPYNIILGKKDQSPDLLLYKDYVQGYIVKYGGYTSHLAIVGRELNIPVYRYDKLEELVSGMNIIVIPQQKYEVVIPDKDSVTIRSIANDNNHLFAKLDEILSTYAKFISTLREFFTIKEFKIKYDPNQNDKMIILYIELDNLQNFYQQVFNNPINIMNKLEERADRGAAFICERLVEITIPYLISNIGLEKTLKIIHQHNPYWLNMSKKYLKLRFGYLDESIIEYLRNLYRESKKEEIDKIDIDDKYKNIAKLTAKCIEIYELKDIKL